jgi:hypothetical protein
MESKEKLEDELATLQALIDRSVRTASPAIADSVAYPERQMSASEFVEFWQSVRLVAMATVERGRPTAYCTGPCGAERHQVAAGDLRQHR